MSKIQELINRLCPDGVTFKPLGELCEIKGRIGFRGYTRADIVSPGDGAISLSPSNIKDGFIDYSDSTYISWKKYEESPEIKVYNGDIIFTKTASVGKTSLVENLIEAATINPQLVVLKEIKCNHSYLSYVLKHERVQNEVRKLSGIGSVPNISQTALSKIQIPVPPIEVQEEIVRILDTFSAHAAELQAELQARKEQYEYYRNLLLTFNPSACGCGTDGEQEIKVTTWGGHSYEIAWKTMGEIGKFIRGKRFVRTDIVEHGIPCIHYGDMYTHYGLYASETPGYINEEIAKKMRFAEKNDVVIVAAGENKEDLGNALAWLGDEPAAVHDACFIFKSEMYPNYLSHVCRTRNYHKQVRMFANEAKICSVSGADLSKLVIPFPPYELQVKIAAVLDKFEALTNDLQRGLPAEIEAVREQYEYYRNKLLTFKKIA